MEKKDYDSILQDYITSHGEHQVSIEQRKVSEELGKPMMEFYMGGTQTTFEFPNGNEVSVIHFPNGHRELFLWDIEIMYQPKVGDYDIFRPQTIEQLNGMLIKWLLD
jgi:hypothetical protein